MRRASRPAALSTAILLALTALTSLAVAGNRPASSTASNDELCANTEAGVNCGPGNNRRTAGGKGTGKVPHHDSAGHAWPAVSGILWQILDNHGRTKAGGPLNDELLGHHGSDTLSGGPGDDIIWGDWDPKGNSSRQRDVLSGGPGNDWLYPSHGPSIVRGGAGRDYVWAYYGHGLIDCGPGKDTARIRTTGAFRTRHCEQIRHFCAHGEDSRGNCLSPSGKPVVASRRSTGD